jgi:uncharacterized protein DUF1592/uncharacterized protein DUF1588/uncharacterized protein DUF1595/uncharacterized protein DUF1587
MMRLRRATGLAAALCTAAAIAPACGTDDPVFPPPEETKFEPAAGGVRRILSHEYTRSIALVLGAEASEAAETPKDIAQEGFDAIGATILPPSAEPIEIYERSAEAVAETALNNPATLAATAPCVSAAQATDSCYREVATKVGRLMWRRPLAQEEIDSLVGVATFAADWDPANAFEAAIKYELMALLQSPNFLYITALGQPDEASGHRKLDAYELASRLSFFLLSRTPDAALLDKAEAGELETPEQIRSAAQTMIESSDARLSVELFYDELLRLRFLAETAKNAETFPTWTPELAAAMRQETLLLVEDLVWTRNADIRTLFNADYTYVNPELAAHYGLILPPGSTGFSKVFWREEQHRAGFTSQGAFLAHQSGPLRNSPTKRGKAVLKFILCEDPPPPPNNVVPELPMPPPGGATLRELLDLHMDDPACAPCHAQTDPIGFAFESFDAIGRHRTADEYGFPIDATGAVDGLGEWTNAAELGELLANDSRTGPCFVRGLVRGKLGHTESSGEARAIDALAASFAEGGHSMQSLLVDMAAHALFRYVNEPR